MRNKTLQRVMDAAGGVSALARELKTTRQAVSKWHKVPASRAWDVERITGIPKEELRPDIFLPPKKRVK